MCCEREEREREKRKEKEKREKEKRERERERRERKREREKENMAENDAKDAGELRNRGQGTTAVANREEAKRALELARERMKRGDRAAALRLAMSLRRGGGRPVRRAASISGG